MKILINMNLSPEWVEVLATHGINAVHWSSSFLAQSQFSYMIVSPR